jgi:5-methylthioribose kinase
LFELTVENAADWAIARGLVRSANSLTAEELAGGVSSAVIALHGEDAELVIKQALPRLRVKDVWTAKTERNTTEASALRLCRELTPDAVPRVLAHSADEHVLAMELVPADAHNWQVEISEGRTHAEAAAWAGTTLGTWHSTTARRPDLAAAFDDFEAFEQLRLRPFHETVMSRRPELGSRIAPRVAELRTHRRCLVHGDYAPKNMLVAAERRWVLDFEVAHFGNPVFDLGFFLSFVVLSAIQWPALAEDLRDIGNRFIDAYVASVGAGFTHDDESVTAHTACLVLSRTDGKSPAQFLDDASRARARAVGIDMLERPEQGLWGWE